MSFDKLISGIFEKKIDFYGRKWAIRFAKIIFLQISQKVKVLELNVVFSTNINIKHTHSGHFKPCLSFLCPSEPEI